MKGIGNALQALRLRRWVLFGVVCTGLVMLLTWGSGEAAARRTTRELTRRAAAAAALHAAVLRSELEKFSTLPIVLTEDHDVREALRSRNAEQLLALDAKLETLSERTRAAVIYVLDTRGVTVAASNWRRQDSFLGSDYSYRVYFHEAMAGRTAEHFALGAVSRKPGLFFARPLVDAGRIIGVVVVKVEFDNLEAEWRSSADPAFVTGADDVVLVTSVPQWRFRTLKPLTAAERERLRRTQQFGREPLAPLPLRRIGRDEVEIDTGGRRLRYIAATTPSTPAGWTLHLLTPSDGPVTNAVVTARSLAFLLGVLLTLAAVLVLRRLEREELRSATEERARAELEARVQERTHELSLSNERLVREMAERRRAETSRQVLQDELVQASKLATLGQIAAGVAHEINQPVAAIRTYADNATVLLERSETTAARANLGAIASLTEKIGLITDELRAFSRKTSAHPVPVGVEEAVNGALLLIGSRARELGVTIVRDGPFEGVRVLAERVRLEQVLVNLLQNALEALAGHPKGVIRIGLQTTGRRARITVTDNGPGVDAAAAANLFTPFVTTKANGLGLGLVISRDLVTEFGGELTLKDTHEGGALFVVSLKRAA